MMSETRVGGLSALHEYHAGAEPLGSLVLLHGLWGGAWLFEDWLAPAAARGWDVWAPNLRGRAGSREVEDIGAVRLQDFAVDLREALSELGPSVVVGYSMGGLITQMVMGDPAARHLIRAAVLLCPIPPRGVVALTGPALRASWRYVPRMAMSRPLLPSREDADTMLMNDLPKSERDRRYPGFIADSGHAAGQIAVGAVAVDAAQVTCPVLVVSAEDDRISPPSVQPKLVRRYGAQHLAFAKRAHLLPIEPSADVAWEMILDRLESAIQ
jgi:pimeloyl-ACP methyl ester carboxylesterase